MTSQKIWVSLDDKRVEMLDRIATREHRSRAGVLWMAVNRFIYDHFSVETLQIDAPDVLDTCVNAQREERGITIEENAKRQFTLPGRM